jgi:hypothetical protein
MIISTSKTKSIVIISKEPRIRKLETDEKWNRTA